MRGLEEAERAGGKEVAKQRTKKPFNGFVSRYNIQEIDGMRCILSISLKYSVSALLGSCLSIVGMDYFQPIEY